MLNCQEDILELFVETQQRHAEPVACQLFGSGGFHTVGNAHRQPKSGTRKADHLAAETQRQDNKIRDRILAGERPNPAAPKPVRWYRIARDLGIDIGEPVTVAEHDAPDARKAVGT